MLRRFGLPAVAAGLLVFAIVSIVQTREVRVPAAPPAPPPTTTYAETVAGVGLVEASTENIAISTPVAGLCLHVYVQAGDRVRAGAPLFSLDDRDLQAELRVRRQALSVTRAQLARLERLPRPEEVPPVEARVAEAQEALADARVQQRLIESVTDRRAIREEDLQRRRIATRAAEARLARARAELALLRAGAWTEDLAVAEAQVAQAEREVRRVETDIARLTVTAPTDGQILQVNLRVGEYAQSGPLAKPLMLMGRVDVLHVRTDVDEHEAWRVRVGAPASATVRGNSGLRMPLHFVRFEPYVIPKTSLSGNSTERVDTRVLQVLYRLDPTPFPLYVGQQVDVFIEGPASPRDGPEPATTQPAARIGTH